MIIDPDTIRAGDVVTMRATFKVSEVTDTEIWNDEVGYPKRSLFPSVVVSWDLFPVTRDPE